MIVANPTNDVIEPRNHAKTEELPRRDPWLTISADEQTVPQRELDPERPTCAELIRAMSASFQLGKNNNA